MKKFIRTGCLILACAVALAAGTASASTVQGVNTASGPLPIGAGNQVFVDIGHDGVTRFTLPTDAGLSTSPFIPGAPTAWIDSNSGSASFKDMLMDSINIKNKVFLADTGLNIDNKIYMDTANGGINVGPCCSGSPFIVIQPHVVPPYSIGGININNNIALNTDGKATFGGDVFTSGDTLGIDNATHTSQLCVNGKCTPTAFNPATCHVVSVTGGPPHYISDARCASDEFALNGGGVANQPHAWNICPASAPASVQAATGFTHTDVPDGDGQGWSIDAYSWDHTSEVCTQAYATCCKR